ncbi:acyl-CoA dehydrogenase C-terminal domain-containing protein [Denitrobaculum tricleocarpae]|uniref:3-methylmercaptopropionyl-CoA dehydrogenase n=1 Tax=Denitrobaculum tricleocarpae TaxID=2591009 RepID=A0A545U384_9PROT|nr:acyl-CoA dehydrogenase C-terminal domain-containing protein [Denitrobaculum tricleocarpae]TQV83873.1 acyl-CoA dehydrogenase [Denitrobaculum tricleocarpae]
MTYTAPLDDMRFVLDEIAGLSEIAGMPGYEDATPDLVDAVLGEAGRLANEVLAPLNHSGDREGLGFENGVVRTPKGFREAYQQYVESGWNSLPFDPDYGGQGLPWALSTAVTEMWNAANMSFALCPLLNQGAVDLLETHATEEQKQTYLTKLISGEWTGTMNLTEPQAGSDVGALKTKAERNGDHYLITGQKIYITWGEHDYTDNIVHLVLARLPDAPAGTKGISLFIVPKFLVNADGTAGPRNDLRCVSLEHKLGVHASPTCVMAYGDNGGAVGYLVGEENNGMACMFTMMNNARLAVGMQGVAIADRAYQQATAFARDRVQSRAIGSSDPKATAIIQHPDVRRMLMTMRAGTEAMRCIAYLNAAEIDRAHRHPDATVRAKSDARANLLTPITKGWATELGCNLTSLGVQIHGGMGFIEETGAAQHYRDARILPIYEGTTGIQALDLLTRKLLRDGGETARGLIEEMLETLAQVSASEDTRVSTLAAPTIEQIRSLAKSTESLLKTGAEDMVTAAAAATPYLNLFGTVVGGWLLCKSALTASAKLASGEGNSLFYDAKIKTARFYLDNILPQASGYAAAIEGAESVMAMDEAQF